MSESDANQESEGAVRSRLKRRYWGIKSPLEGEEPQWDQAADNFENGVHHAGDHAGTGDHDGDHAGDGEDGGDGE